VLNSIYSTVTTPCLIMEQEKILEMLSVFVKHFGRESVFYAIKANSDIALLRLLNDNMANFEVSSCAELNVLHNMRIDGQRIISASPIKTKEFVKSAFKAGLNYFVADSVDEVRKIAAYAPSSSVVIRLTVSNKGSEWPLERKFGVATRQAIELLEEAQRLELATWGFSFHVGSQCNRPDTWKDAIRKVGFAWRIAEKKGIRLQGINIGGGFPIRYIHAVTAISEIAKIIFDSIKEEIPKVKTILVEPGRALVGEAGTIVATVIGKSIRNKERWLYVDAGVFNALTEILGGIHYPIEAQKQGKQYKWKVAGPTCDSMDIVSEQEWLPDLNIDDRVLFKSAGAYTTVYASTFNGYPIPPTILI